MSATANKDLYAILGIQADASPEEIKRAYRTAAKRYHPDRTGGDKAKEARFKEITAAYQVLSNPDRRRQYDVFRQGPVPGTSGPGGIPFDLGDLFGSAMGGRGASAGAGFGGFGDLFEQIFGAAGARGSGPGRGTGRVTFEEFTGAMPGAGGRHGHASSSSGSSGSSGTVQASDGSQLVRHGYDLHSDLPVSIDEAVLGTRVEVATIDGRVTVTVPPGTSSGQRLRLRGKGLRGRGDHYVTIQIVVPRQVDEPTRELLREFARRAPVRPRR